MQSSPITRIGLSAACLVCVLAWAGNAVGQSNDGLRFKRAYKDGMDHYKKGQFDMAVEDFRTALDLKSHPVVIYNLSQSYVQLGKWEEAVNYAGMAIDLGGLQGKTAAQNLATDRAGRVVLSARNRAPEIARAEPVKSVREEQPTSVADSRSSTDTAAVSNLGWSGAGIGLVGAGLMGGALLVDAGLKDDFDALEDAAASGDRARVSQIQSNIDSTQANGRALLYTGIGVTALGTAIFIYDVTKGGETSRGVSAGLAPRKGGAHIQVNVAFE